MFDSIPCTCRRQRTTSRVTPTLPRRHPPCDDTATSVLCIEVERWLDICWLMTVTNILCFWLATLFTHEESFRQRADKFKLESLQALSLDIIDMHIISGFPKSPNRHATCSILLFIFIYFFFAAFLAVFFAAFFAAFFGAAFFALASAIIVITGDKSTLNLH